jgi:hypothetical protein
MVGISRVSDSLEKNEPSSILVFGHPEPKETNPEIHHAHDGG